jgi:hypothetical protein
VPDGADALLSGKIVLSGDKVVLLSKKQPKAIKSAMERLADPSVTFDDVFPEYGGKARKASASVKDAPAYDPDAQVTGLVYTIPSWIDSLERVGCVDLRAVSSAKYSKLMKAIDELKTCAADIVERMVEGAE